MKESIGFIGCGNMGCGILRGILGKRLLTAKRVWVYEKDAERMARLKKFFGVREAKSLGELCRDSNIVILAIKPQQVNEVASLLKPVLGKNHTVVSILAGTTLASLRKYLGPRPSLVRVMPNLGALVGESMSAVCGTNPKSVKKILPILSSCGEVIALKEALFNLVTAVSGSGPAYFFLLMELLEKEAKRGGVSPKEARKLALQTAVSASSLAKGTPHSPEELRAMVTSKKGTTEAALNILKRYSFDKIFHKAIQKAAQRAKELSK